MKATRCLFHIEEPILRAAGQPQQKAWEHRGHHAGVAEERDERHSEELGPRSFLACPLVQLTRRQYVILIDGPAPSLSPQDEWPECV